MNRKTLAMTLLLGLATTSLAQAEEAMTHHEGHDMAAMEAPKQGDMAQMVMTKGVITRIDEANQKLGIKHEAITNLNMPAMTMVFNLADPAQLKELKVGDAISFHAENQGGKITLTHLQKQ